ncbi:MAG: DUF393 domain-containing protein [Pacificimonas sp.]
MLTVYYNSACPVCKAGIEDQQARMIRRDVRGNAEWVDIACNADVIAPLGLEVEAVRHSLHVVEDGRMRIGADAFLALARVTPGQRWLVPLLGNPVMLPLTRFAYDRFADLLYWWNRRRGRW